MHLTPGVVYTFPKAVDVYVIILYDLYPLCTKRFLLKKRRVQPLEFWSLVSTKDGSTLPQDCVEEQLC